MQEIACTRRNTTLEYSHKKKSGAGKKEGMEGVRKWSVEGYICRFLLGR
jgi:hypothetical protein